MNSTKDTDNDEFSDQSSGDIPDKITPVDLLRIKESIANQCFEMMVHLNLGSTKKLGDGKSDVLLCEDELAEVRTKLSNQTLALNRMQVWNTITSKLVQNDCSEELKLLAQQSLSRFGRIKKLQQESQELQYEITNLQKERLNLKVLIKKQTQELGELKRAQEAPDEAERRTMEKADSVIQNYQKVITITQNILRGIIMATRVNWMDDPKLKDIAMVLENMPN